MAPALRAVFSLKTQPRSPASWESHNRYNRQQQKAWANLQRTKTTQLASSVGQPALPGSGCPIDMQTTDCKEVLLL